MGAIKDHNLEEVTITITSNLDLLPSHIDFANYPTYLDLKFGLVSEDDPTYEKVNIQKSEYFSSLLDPLKNKYDYIFVDVPPTKSIITDSAVIAADYVLIILQTQELSLDGATQYLEDLLKISNSIPSHFEILGILPVLMDHRATLDKFILQQAEDIFGKENIFTTKITNMSRLKRFDNTGIRERDQFDKRVIDLYKIVTQEFLEKIRLLEIEESTVTNEN